jgi:hypothetical protein
LIHLLTKPRLRRIKWAASRLLLASYQRNTRQMKIEDLILLLLRCLLVALLVLIFARPALLTSDSGPEFGQGPVAAVILLDYSGSMGQTNGVHTRFEQAKEMADDILSKLPSGSGSSCALYLVADGVKTVIPKPTTDFALVRRILDEATLSDRGTDLLPGIKAGYELLKGMKEKDRELFILTDSQMSAWRQLDKIIQLQHENQKDISMHLLVVGDKGEDNLAVSNLQIIGTTAAVNQPLRCSIQVSNWGSAPAEKVAVKLATDDNPPEDQTLIDEIDPGASRTVNLFVRFHDPGFHSLTASIPGDHLPSDDQRSLAVLVLEKMAILVVDGTNAVSSDSDGFFLRHALVPVRPDQVADYYMKVTEGQPTDLLGSTISDYATIFLSNVAQLTTAEALNLKQYVGQGGSLIVFPGSATDVNFYNTDPNFSVLLPAQLGPATDAPGSTKFLTWQSKDYEHPVTALWNDPDSGNLGSVRFYRYFPLKVPDAPAAGTASPPAIVLKYTNGEVAVVEHSFGKGRVFLFGSTATTAWNTFPLHPSFVPMLMRTVAYANSNLAQNLTLSPGHTFGYSVSSEYSGQDFFVQPPGKKDERLLAGKVDSCDQTGVIRYSDTDLAGPYRIFIGDDTKPKVIFAVQGDPDESNLKQEYDTDLDPLLHPKSNEVAADASPSDASAAKVQKVPGQELAFPLAIAALILALGELAMAHRSSQSK